jgi:hypothetical protein
MPEEIEIDTDKLRETIDEEIERTGSRMLRVVALSTAILAAVTAIVSLQAGSTINEALVLESQGTQLQAQASDQWAYYQAKGIKGAIASSAMSSYAASGRGAPDSLRGQTAKYASEQASIQTAARKLEAERDEKVADAERLIEQHHHFAFAVALLQVSIALGAVAALTRQKPALALSMLAGLAGIIVSLLAAFR